MKKIKYFICVILIFVSSFVLIGCTNLFSSGNNGGKDGLSAYEIAVKHGFEGTEEEWLESLKGKNGSNGANGNNGKDGQDLSVDDLFSKAVDLGLYADKSAESYDKFLKDYFNDNVKIESVESVANKCLNQVVGVYAVSEDNSIGAGAGVFYQIDRTNKFAYIITNYHVVATETEVENETVYSEASTFAVCPYGVGSPVREQGSVTYTDRTMFAEYIGGSADYDLAILRISGEEFSKLPLTAESVTFADTTNIQLGSTAIAIGNPMGSGVAVTSGHVSCDSEFSNVNISGALRSIRCIRISTPVNGGNSGGGAFDINGHLIGIVNSKKSNYVELDGSLMVYENIAYAIAGNNVEKVADNIIDFYNLLYDEQKEDNTVGVYKYIIGITIEVGNTRNEYNKQTNINTLYEDVIVTDVTGLSAQTIGFKKDDIIKSVNVVSGGNSQQVDITRRFILLDTMLALRIGDSVTYTVSRFNETLGEYEDVTLDSFTVSEAGYTVYKGSGQ